jgi:hypothetical protein
MNNFIKSQGISKTIIQSNNQTNINNIAWNAEYDGHIANMSVNILKNGDNKQYTMSLTNNDIHKLLNTPNENGDLYQRLLPLKKTKNKTNNKTKNIKQNKQNKTNNKTKNIKQNKTNNKTKNIKQNKKTKINNKTKNKKLK